jgi:hypothetical protein
VQREGDIDVSGSPAWQESTSVHSALEVSQYCSGSEASLSRTVYCHDNSRCTLLLAARPVTTQTQTSYFGSHGRRCSIIRRRPCLLTVGVGYTMTHSSLASEPDQACMHCTMPLGKLGLEQPSTSLQHVPYSYAGGPVFDDLGGVSGRLLAQQRTTGCTKYDPVPSPDLWICCVALCNGYRSKQTVLHVPYKQILYMPGNPYCICQLIIPISI